MEGNKTTRICTLMLTNRCNLDCVYCFEKYKLKYPAKMMDMDTVVKILSKELFDFEKNGNEGRLGIELFGGEPLLNFPLIKFIYKWMKSRKTKVRYIFQITTNGTLLNAEIKEWLLERKGDFRIILSVDGTEAMQEKNRGCGIDELPVDFVKNTWPDSYFKLTLSRDTLRDYSKGIITLSEKGYKIASSLAEGVRWEIGDESLFRKELEAIAVYYYENRHIEPQHPFNFTFKEYLGNNQNQLPHKNCGVGTSIQIYDVDGLKYPCHLFLPIVHGKSCKEDIDKLRFTNNDMLISSECKQCKVLKVCRTCYGYNYVDRGDISSRDKLMCELRLIEAQIVSSFQINYLSSKEDLNSEELLMLKAAVRCYDDLKNFSFRSN